MSAIMIHIGQNVLISIGNKPFVDGYAHDLEVLVYTNKAARGPSVELRRRLYVVR